MKGAHERMTAVKTFTARVETGERGRVFITVPFDPNSIWGKRPRHYVHGTINGTAFSGSLGSRAGAAFFPLNKALQAAAAISIGSVVEVTLQPALAESDAVPADLAAALATTETARGAFAALTSFQHNQFVRWIVAAKKSATRARRVADAVTLLTHGKTLPE